MLDGNPHAFAGWLVYGCSGFAVLRDTWLNTVGSLVAQNPNPATLCNNARLDMSQTDPGGTTPKLKIRILCEDRLRMLNLGSSVSGQTDDCAGCSASWAEMEVTRLEAWSGP